jgi:hypothetical protein
VSENAQLEFPHCHSGFSVNLSSVIPSEQVIYLSMECESSYFGAKLIGDQITNMERMLRSMAKEAGAKVFVFLKSIELVEQKINIGFLVVDDPRRKDPSRDAAAVIQQTFATLQHLSGDSTRVEPVESSAADHSEKGTISRDTDGKLTSNKARDGAHPSNASAEVCVDSDAGVTPRSAQLFPGNSARAENVEPSGPDVARTTGDAQPSGGEIYP